MGLNVFKINANDTEQYVTDELLMTVTFVNYKMS